MKSWKVYLKDGSQIQKSNWEYIEQHNDFIKIKQYYSEEIEEESGLWLWKKKEKSIDWRRSTVAIFNKSEIKYCEYVELNQLEGER